ncbi:hypothetical protein LAh2_21 [Aeromonas phage LAh2]|uniref:Uncharacterized protein n=1 Tax=Aeromonas phage LAh1 TaxID=2591024 RepID=A0A513ZZ18_9CAUD|nr:hypothetical protein LAh1_21 [Aeromonas phage LAh1]QDH46315.1 hypothetical protein LAh2_21 [Aeromonas phage LAh2]QDH46361.1 hypothetical protein LAh3_24 [Aeromonas phage LAh3]QDH46411.1 hypothetical protein LAh4_26 [Aeromonas phage LAh4]QDH46464.1 hypothetical protein LAh5_27 [Aeromonas phage LAh5]
MSFKSGPVTNTLAVLGDQLYVKASATLSALKYNEYFIGLNVASLVSVDDDGIKLEVVMRDALGRQLVHVAGYDIAELLADFQRACMDYNDLKMKAAQQHG